MKPGKDHLALAPCCWTTQDRRLPREETVLGSARSAHDPSARPSQLRKLTPRSIAWKTSPGVILVWPHEANPRRQTGSPNACAGVTRKGCIEATRPGFEPGQRGPKPLVLPLHYRVWGGSRLDCTAKRPPDFFVLLLRERRTQATKTVGQICESSATAH